ncbi:glycosyltransferase [Limimaricola hongkongensis]|nr:glycosyltransferase family 2 protein [Limimaricola hongkongensis]
MLLILSIIGLALAALFAAMCVVNLSVLRPPEGTGGDAVSILIPARDEAGNIGAALDAALGQRGVELEVVVLDDGSTDGTDAIVAARAESDARLRLVRGAALPEGWIGKTHACWQVSRHARHPVMLFVDADVRLAPDAATRLSGEMTRRGLDLLSGFPGQRTPTWAEKIVIPQIFTTLLGYLPLPMARARPDPAFGAGCGQLMAVRRDAYTAAGGHAAFAGRMHDGLELPRRVRGTGGRTDLCDATPVATCRMYATPRQIWDGFSKNATEGMATKRALPVWTILLFGGHVLPFLTLIAGLVAGAAWPVALSALACAMVLGARMAMAVRLRQSWLSVAAHPLGVMVVLAIQFAALWNAGRGRRAVWRGRDYGIG